MVRQGLLRGVDLRRHGANHRVNTLGGNGCTSSDHVDVLLHVLLVDGKDDSVT
jgi:hypothetical protein